MADVSDQNDSRPSLETEAVSGDEDAGGAFEEVKLDLSMLNPECLKAPTIPDNLGPSDIDNVIAALTNVPDLKASDSPKKTHHINRSSAKKRRNSGYNDRDDRYDERDRYEEKYDRGDDLKQRRSSDGYEEMPQLKRVPIGFLRGRGRGRLRMRARALGRAYITEQARGLFAGGRVSRRAVAAATAVGGPENADGTRVFPVARGRNIFPEDERGRGDFRGRGFITRENALFKRFKQQHRLDHQQQQQEHGYGNEEHGYYDDRRTRSRSRSRSRSSSSSGSSAMSSSDSDSGSSPRKKKKKKDKKKRKSEKKKKKRKIKEEKDSGDEKEAGDWRVGLLNKMKNIKNLPPEQLEVEFKKAMAEKRRREEEEKCLENIKQRQKLARKVKKESEKAAKKASKEKKKEPENSFYAGYNGAAVKAEEEDQLIPARMYEEEDPKIKSEWVPAEQPVFKPSFSEVSKDADKENSMDGLGGEAPQELDPYTRALEEHNRKEPKREIIEEVQWPAGALEESGLEAELSKEQMDLIQEQERQAFMEKTKHVVSASKMFSKIRNRIKSKPLKINLKMNKPAEEDEGPGLQPKTGENTPAEGLSDGEKEDTWYDEDLTEYDFRGNEDGNLVRRMERMRQKKEVHDPGELEDGEHSPSPEPVRPHLRRKRKIKTENRDGTPLLDEPKVLEEGEIDNDAPSPAHKSPWVVTGVPPPPMGSAISFLDTSVPPPNMPGMVGGFGPSRPPLNIQPNHFAGGPMLGFPPIGMPAIPPPVPILNPNLIRPGERPALLGAPPLSIQPPDPYADYDKRNADRYGRRYDEYDRREDRRDDRYDRSRDRYDRREDNYDDRRDYDRRSRDKSHHRTSESRDDFEYDRRSDKRGSRRAAYRDDSDEDQGPKDDGAIDITKITPIMKYIAKNLEESKYALELRGPFAFNTDSPGLSKHLFVAYKVVHLLETGGYDQSKMYMQAMFPAGLSNTKTEIIEKAKKGKLDAEIHGPKLVKMVVRCIKCFIAYFSGKKDDIQSSDEEGDGAQSKETRTVNTSLSSILGRIKEESAASAGREDVDPNSDPLNRVLETQNDIRAQAFPDVPDTILNPWGAMDTKVKANHYKSFNSLQSHFQKQLMGKGLDPREAREQSADCMMCLVVTGWNDSMLREMVTRFKKTILPEQAALEEKRTGSNRTLYDQMVELMLKHTMEFPWALTKKIEDDPNPEDAMEKKVRNIVERMLKFYMRGCGKIQEGREPSTNQPGAPGDYQFNYIPDGLREDEGADQDRPKRVENNFFNIEAATVANRSFSSYNKRGSMDQEAGMELEPVSPDNGEIIKGSLPKKKYLFGTMYIDTITFRGSNYVYEIGIYMSDTSSCEVNIVPNNLFTQRSALEMLGFSSNPDESKFIYVKPGGGFQKSYNEQQGLEKVIQFLKEKRFESKGDSRNSGLVLITKTTGELATWESFNRYHKMDLEQDDIIAGYGVLDNFIQESLGNFTYVGPTMNQETDKTFFTWEYNRNGKSSENMAGTKAGALLKILEDLLEGAPDYENFIKHNCFHSDDSRFQEVRRKENIVKDLYNLECFLSDALNERNLRKKIYTGGIFCPSSTAELGDKPGLVANRFVRFMVECGLSRPALKDRAVECRERGAEFVLPLDPVLKGMRKLEERAKCQEQIERLTKVVAEYILSK